MVIGKCDDDDCDGTLYQREDDKAEVVARRIEVYNQETQPILDYYREAGILSDVDGEQSVGSVGDALQSAVNA